MGVCGLGRMRTRLAATCMRTSRYLHAHATSKRD
jgi:hypothetical protein